MKKRVRGTIGFVAVTLCLVFVTAFCVVMTVKSQSNAESEALETYYRGKERELLCQTREYLQQEGYKNCGVTMTRVVEENGYREYTVTIHHKKISRLPETDKRELTEKLKSITFQDENCSFYHTFF